MSDKARLAAEIDAFSSIIDELAAIAARVDPERRLELTKVRRRLSDQISLIREAGAQAILDPELADEFRSRVSAVLTVVATHQANWPAVSIDDGGAAYRKSAEAAAVSNRTFINWTRAALQRMR